MCVFAYICVYVFACMMCVYICRGVGVEGGAGRGGPGALTIHPALKSCVQAVSNKLLNLIKRGGIILQGPEGAQTSAIMNIFGLIITPPLQSPPQEKTLCPPRYHIREVTPV